MTNVSEALSSLAVLTERRLTKKQLSDLYGIQPTVNAKGVVRQKARVGGSARRAGGGPQLTQKLKRDLYAQIPSSLQDEYLAFLREQDKKPDLVSLSINQMRSVAGNLAFEGIRGAIERRQATGARKWKKVESPDGDKNKTKLIHSDPILDKAILQAVRTVLRRGDVDVASVSSIKRVAIRKAGSDLKDAGRKQPDTKEMLDRVEYLVREGHLTLRKDEISGAIVGIGQTTKKRLKSAQSFSKGGQETVSKELASFLVSSQADGGQGLSDAAKFMARAVVVFLDELPMRRKDYRDLLDEVEELDRLIGQPALYKKALSGLKKKRATLIQKERKLKADRKTAGDLAKKQEAAIPKNQKAKTFIAKREKAKKAKAAHREVTHDWLAVKDELVLVRASLTSMQGAKKRLPEAKKELEEKATNYVSPFLKDVGRAADNLQKLVGKLEKVSEGKTRDYAIESLLSDVLAFWQPFNDAIGRVSPMGAAHIGEKVRGGG